MKHIQPLQSRNLIVCLVAREIDKCWLSATTGGGATGSTGNVYRPLPW